MNLTQRRGIKKIKRYIFYALVMVAVSLPASVYSSDELVKLSKDPGQWVMQGKNYSATRYSELNQVTTSNVSGLKAAWNFSTGALRGHEGSPLVIGSTMYVHSAFPNHVYALDLTKKPYAIKWKYTPKQDERAVPVACCDTVNRGLGYGNGKIFLNTLDGQVIAMDANTGKVVWNTKHADPGKGETITNAPLIVKDKVIVGISGGEFGVRGRLTAYDINTGKLIWVGRNAGPDEDLLLHPDFNKENPHYGRFGEGTKTWPGEEWKIGGSTAWGWLTYDPETNLVYYGTSNPGTWNPTPRKGDNKWSVSLIGRDVDTGKARWAYQMTPWDAWDFDGINELILTDLTIGGKKVKAAVHFDRNGFGYTLDRTNGTLHVAQPFVHVNWATGVDLKTGRPIEVPEKRTKQGIDTKNICPCAMGGKDQQPASFSPLTGLFYVPTNNMCMNYEGVLVKYTAGAPYVGANVLMFPGHEGKDDYWGIFKAWDATTGKTVWEIKEKFPAWSGVLTTAGGLVFYGTMDGWFKAVDQKTGKLLWQHKVGSGIIAAPMTFLGPDKKQYVAVYSGVGGWFGLPISAGLPPDDPFGALGATGAAYQSGLDKATSVGGELNVFALE